MRRSIVAVGSIMAVSLLVTACGNPGSQADSEQRVLTLGVAGVDTFDHAGLASAGEGLTIWQGVYDTLITLDPDGELSPGLATEWAFDESQTVLTVELRSGVAFSDGEPFDAEAVVANYKHFAETVGANIAMAASITGVVAQDDDTVEYTLSEPDPGLEYSLAGALGAMASPVSLGSDDLTTQPIGTGPYEMDLDRTVTGSEIVFTRRDSEHWNGAAWAWDEITFKVLPDQSARVNALRAGEIDGTLVNAQSFDEVSAAGFDVLSNPGDYIGLGLFDRDGVVQPALADVRVRQAINHAFDREEMLESIQLGHGRVTDQLFPGVEPVGGTEYSYDPEKAKKLLAEAGYADGFSMTGVDLGTGSPLYAIITDRLAAIGIDMDWQPVAPTDAVSEMFSARYPAFNAAWDGGGVGGNPWFFVMGGLQPTSLWNVFKNDPPELAALIEEARHASGDDRDLAYGKIDGWLSTNAWFAPFYQVDYLYALSPEVTATSAVGNASPFLWTFQPAGNQP
jgi:peptide/nickel transport system substrate-binding protein